MKNIVWLINPLTFTEKEFEFPTYICEQMNGLLKVLFLENDSLEYIPFISNDPVFPTVEYGMDTKEINDKNQNLAEENKALFFDIVKKRNIALTVHNENGTLMEQVVEESRFADMILVKASMSVSYEDDRYPSSFVKQVLTKTECPVLIMPEDSQTINEIYFTYNGGHSSVFAIKHFSYLFPSFKYLPVTVLYVSEEENKKESKHINDIREFLYAQYKHVTVKVLQGTAEAELFSELALKKNIIVTFGAFGRSSLSRFFRKSSANSILETIDIPAFITHP
ncbi:MAG TPA: universal stress protein [Ferruginibacter sp.]|nr:universal stress protein [Ferruginibacter sp.]